MALTFGAVIYDGPRCKIFTVTDLDNAAANNLTVTFATTPGMTDFQGASVGAPVPEAHVVCTLSAADTAYTLLAITAQSATACTIRKVLAGGGANVKTWRITLRFPRGIGA